MQLFKKTAAGLLAAMLAFSTGATTVLAAENAPYLYEEAPVTGSTESSGENISTETQTQSGSITVTLEKKEGLNPEGVGLTLVRIADVIDGEYVYTSMFREAAAQQKIDINNLKTADELKTAAFKLMNIFKGKAGSSVQTPSSSDQTEEKKDSGLLTEGPETDTQRMAVNETLEEMYSKIEQMIATGGAMVDSKAQAYLTLLINTAKEKLESLGLTEERVQEIISLVKTKAEEIIRNSQDKLTQEAGDSTVLNMDTDAEGVCKFDGLKTGVYLLFADSISGYELIAPTLLAIPTWDEENSTMNYQLTVTPKTAPLPEVQIVKTDSSTKKKIEGKQFAFGLYSDQACTKLVQKQTDPSDDGDAVFTLPFGTWYIKEITAPEGYQLSDKVVTIVFDEKGVTIDGTLQKGSENLIMNTEKQVYTVEYENTPIPEVPSNKTDFNTGLRGWTGWILGGIAVCLVGLFFAIRAKKKAS